MRMITVASTFWRPILSPSGPKKSPPNGRVKKATAKTANVLSNCTVGSWDAKNAAPINGARNP